MLGLEDRAHAANAYATDDTVAIVDYRSYFRQRTVAGR
jgi:hypothetical protein